MNLDYQKIKHKIEEGVNHWTSFSDLFLVLTVVFLLLFVVANLKSGSTSVVQKVELAAVQKENTVLKKRLSVFESLKDDYLAQGPTAEEAKTYDEVMSHLYLLEGIVKNEKESALLKAKEAETKERHLNQYQEIIKSIIHANLLSAQKLQQKEQTIDRLGKDIGELNGKISRREHEIDKNLDTIDKIKANLQKRIEHANLVAQVKASRASKAEMKDYIEKLKRDSAEKIGQLNSKNSKFVSQLADTRALLEQKNRETERLMTSLREREEDFQEKIEELKASHSENIAKEKEEFQRSIKSSVMTAKAAIQREKEHRIQVEKKNRDYILALNSLNNQLEHTQDGIQVIKTKYQESIASLNGVNQALTKDMATHFPRENDQRIVVETIQKNFQKAGLKMAVDSKNGDVTINFENEYFDTGQAVLKPSMREILAKAVPIYANSLMKDPRVAKQVGSVEIVGFASPTFKKRFVDPDKLAPENRSAVNYNMDLSYQRAKAIFAFIFDTRNMRFKYQDELLPLVKVSGRSYLASEKIPESRRPSSVDEEEDFCKKLDCKRSQKAIIKFYMKNE